MQSPLTYRRGDKIDGRYFIHQALQGERGEVYLCLDLETSQPYALKTVSARNLHDERYLDAFNNEVAVRVTLGNHANIVRCYDHSTIARRPFMFLEWIIGDEGLGNDLSDWIRHNRLNLQQSLNFTIQICNGLIYAGEKVPGIVHGWLKPGNLLVGKDGAVKINDFGQSPETKGALLAPITVSAAPYLAPERWEGEELDPRSDIYALGCILFEMLNGYPPFEAEAADEFCRLHTAEEIPLIADRLNLPAEIDVVLTRCLAKNKEERFPGPRELLSELSRIYQMLFSPLPAVDKGEYDFTSLEFRHRAQIYASLERYEEAAADLMQALDSEPQNTDIYYERGLIHEQNGQLDKALADFNHAIELDAFNEKAFSARGGVNRKLHNYEQALDDHMRALEINPESALGYGYRGHTYLVLDRNDEALEDFNKVIQLDPSLDIAYFNRGSTLMKLGRFEEAVADFTRCVEVKFGRASSYTHRAAAYFRLGRHEEAADDISRAIEVNPKDPFAYLLRGDIHTLRRQYDAAVNDYSVAIEYGYQPLADAYLKRGIVYAQGKQDYQSAIVDLNHAIELDPQLELAYGARAESQNELGNHREALADVNKIVELGGHFSESQAFYNTRSKAHWGLGAFEEALADANRALAAQPEADMASFFNRANAYSGLGRLREAIRDYDSAIERNPFYAMSFNNRGASYAGLEDYDRALADLVQAVRLDPSCALIYRNMGGVLDMRGAKERAMLYLAAAVKLGDAVAAEVYPSSIIEVVKAAMASGRMGAAEDAFLRTGSFPDVLLTVARFPFLTNPVSISSKEQALENMRSSPLYPMWSEQLKWLKACAEDTPLPDVDDPKLLSADEHEDETFIDTARVKQAIGAYESAISLHVDDTSFSSALIVNKGLTLELLGKMDEALACYRQALQVHPEQIYAYYFMGKALYKLGDLNEALNCYDCALKINPENAEFWLKKATVVSDLGMKKEEMICYDRVLAIDPKNEVALVNKGMLLGRKGEYLKAMEYMGMALQENPELDFAWVHKGLALLSLERASEAINCFDRALELDPTYGQAWVLKGKGLSILGRDDDAADCFIKLIELTPADPQTLEEAGEELFDLGKMEEALRFYEQAVEVAPQRDGAWLGRGTALGELGHFEEAISCFDHAIELNPRNILAWFNKGVILVNGLKDYSEALGCFEQAKRLGHEEAEKVIWEIREAQATEAFEKATSSDEMSELVSQFPLMATPEFLSTIERSIEEGSFASDKEELMKHVNWLREIIVER